MNFKTKLTKKAISLLLLVAMVLTLSANIGFSAFATEQQEIDFCVDKMKNLPTDSEFLEEMLKLPSKNELKKSRKETITHSDGTKEENIPIDEEEVYKDIKEMVDSLPEEIGDEKAQSTSKLSEKMKKAGAIYRWATENIKYDLETKCAKETLAKRKPQDAYFVFKRKEGVCDGFARLVNLMMRMAGIPCMHITTISNSEGNGSHAFNAIYIDDGSEQRRGWTLLDSTWEFRGAEDKIKDFISGESMADKDKFEQILLRGDGYVKDILDELQLSGETVEIPNDFLIDSLNKNIPDILERLNGQYKDGVHFKTIHFSTDASNVLKFKFETDMTVEQAERRCNDEILERKKGEFESIAKKLTGKSKEDLGFLAFSDISNNIKKDDLYQKISLNPILRFALGKINEKYVETNNKYVNDLEKICAEAIYPHLSNIESQLKSINSEFNRKLQEINKNYADLTTIKEVELNLYREEQSYRILGDFDVKMSGEELKKTMEDRWNALEGDSALEKELNVQKQNKLRGYFPAFYNTEQSFEDANRNMINDADHKIEYFEVFSVETCQKINFPVLVGNEGNAKLSLYSGWVLRSSIKDDWKREIEKNFEEMIISNDQIKCGGLSINNKYNLEVMIPSKTEKLTIEGDATIDISGAFNLKDINTTNSKKYDFENGILYEKVDGKRGKEIAKISSK